jgi:hypothetical protein
MRSSAVNMKGPRRSTKVQLGPLYYYYTHKYGPLCSSEVQGGQGRSNEIQLQCGQYEVQRSTKVKLGPLLINAVRCAQVRSREVKEGQMRSSAVNMRSKEVRAGQMRSSAVHMRSREVSKGQIGSTILINVVRCAQVRSREVREGQMRWPVWSI